MNLPTQFAPRFGATLNTYIAANTPNTMLEKAKLLNDAKATVADRIKAIKDEKDPIKLQLEIGADSYALTYATDYSGRGEYKPEENETPAAFMERVTTATEAMVPKLMNQQECHANYIRQADSFVRPVLGALVTKSAEFVSSKDESPHWGRTCRSAVMRVNGETYQLSRGINSKENTHHYSIGTVPAEGKGYDSITSLSVEWGPKGVTDIRLHTPTIFEVNIQGLSTNKEAIGKMGDRLKQLFGMLEEAGAFRAVDIAPLI